MAEANPNAYKMFMVTDEINNRTRMFPFKSYEIFLQKCKSAFKIDESASITFFDANKVSVEIDEDCFELLANDFHFILKRNDTVTPKQTSVEIPLEGNKNIEKEKQQGEAVPSSVTIESVEIIEKETEEEKQQGEAVPSKVTIECGEVTENEIDGEKQQHEAVPSTVTIESDEIIENEIEEVSVTMTLPLGKSKAKKQQGEAVPSTVTIGSDEITENEIEEEKQQHEAVPSTVTIEIDEITGNEIEEGKTLSQHIAAYGLKLKAILDNWKRKPLNIGVTGASGKGKSSLINALRNLSDKEEGAAEVDEIECTVECRSYHFPGQDNFVLWDVPGVGTKSFPRETYLMDIDIDKFDLFMLVSTERFSEVDIWLAKEIRKRDKIFYFIQTKVDVQMDNIRDREEAEFNEENAFSTLKAKTEARLIDDFGNDQFKLIMLSNKRRCRNMYDFPNLISQLLEDVPSEKKMIMAFGLEALSSQVIESKASFLESRIWKVALISVAGAAIPIPFVSNAIERAIILEEILFYRKQLSLDDDSLNKLAQSADITLECLKAGAKFATPTEIFTANGLAAFMTGIFDANASLETILYIILKMMTLDAISVLTLLSKKQTSV